MQVAAADPKWVSRDQVPAADVEKEKDIFRAQMANAGKPAAVIEKIIEGKLDSFFERVCLLDQVCGPRRCEEDLADDRRGRRQDRREHRGGALRPVQARGGGGVGNRIGN